MNLNVDYIIKKNLRVGVDYYCLARNFTIGRWNGEDFDYERQKFGKRFPDTEKHWDEGAPYGTVKPLAKLNEQYFIDGTFNK